VIATIAGSGVAGYSGDGGKATLSQLNLPYGWPLDAAGNLYIADLGTTSCAACHWTGSSPPLPPVLPMETAAQLGGGPGRQPLYLRVRRAPRPKGVADGKVAVVAGTGKPGFSGDGGPPDQAQLAYPAGLAIDRGGALLIADSQNNRVAADFCMEAP